MQPAGFAIDAMSGLMRVEESKDHNTFIAWAFASDSVVPRLGLCVYGGGLVVHLNNWSSRKIVIPGASTSSRPFHHRPPRYHLEATSGGVLQNHCSVSLKRVPQTVLASVIARAVSDSADRHVEDPQRDAWPTKFQTFTHQQLSDR